MSDPVKSRIEVRGDHGTEQGAVLSPDETYRYRLWRTIRPPEQTTLGDDTDRRTLAFILLNPSTADATTDDPTLRRCMGYAERWGYDIVELGNLFALRATDPERLYLHGDPVGPDNDHHLREIASDADMVVAGWGNHGRYLDRGEAVRDLLDGDLYALDVNDTGEPAHPLYQPADAEPVPYPGGEPD